MLKFYVEMYLDAKYIDEMYTCYLFNYDAFSLSSVIKCELILFIMVMNIQIECTDII